MDDLDIPNKKFTWFNKRRETTLIKLVRVLQNAEWNLNFLQTSAMSLTAITWDHTPIVVDFNRDTAR